MQDKIIAAIEAYLEKVTTKDSNGFLNQFTWGHTSKIHATEISAAIAPLVEAGEPDWKNAPEWAEWRIFDEKNNVAYSHGFPSENTQMQVPKDFGTTQKVERRPQ